MAVFQACQSIESIVVSVTRCALYVHCRGDGNDDFYCLKILYAKSPSSQINLLAQCPKL